MDKGKQKNQYLEINIYWIYCRLSFIRIMFLYVVCWMILLTMKGKRKEKKSDARLQTKTDWTPRLWVEAQCSICPTTYLRSHRTPITCFIHSREKRKRKERRKWKENEKSDAHGLEQTKADQTRMPFGSICPILHKTASYIQKNIFVTHQKHQKARSGGTTKEKRKSRWSDKDRLVVAKPEVNGSICLYCPDLVFPQLYITMCSVPTATPHCQLHNCTFSIWIYCMKSEIHCRLNMGLFV